MLGLLLTLALASTASVASSSSSSAPAQTFDVAFANTTLHLAWSSFCNATALRLWTCEYCAFVPGIELVAYLQDPKAGTRGYVAVDRARARLVVGYRGSIDTVNWIEDGMTWHSPFPPARAAPAGRNATVHHGFLLAYETLRNQTRAGISAGLRACTECTEVLFTGHSLGAGMITLAAAEYASEQVALWEGAQRRRTPSTPPRKINTRLYTFGCPRVGNAAFATWALRVREEKRREEKRRRECVVWCVACAHYSYASIVKRGRSRYYGTPRSTAA
jgi:hypothetical protein